MNETENLPRVLPPPLYYATALIIGLLETRHSRGRLQTNLCAGHFRRLSFHSEPHVSRLDTAVLGLCHQFRKSMDAISGNPPPRRRQISEYWKRRGGTGTSVWGGICFIQRPRPAMDLERGATAKARGKDMGPRTVRSIQNSSLRVLVP